MAPGPPLRTLRTGTSGYSYKEWKGPFYPEKLAAKDMLAFYAERLPAVEINNTFYRLPRKNVIETWAEQVPESFRFSIKASRRITERFERLAKFLDDLPEHVRCAFEFRHESWLDESVFELLRGANAALVIGDSEEEPAVDIVPTADWGYLRLRRSDYERADLASWADRIRNAGWTDTFAFFKHEDDGAGPAMAAQMLEVAERAADRKPASGRGSKSSRKAG